MLEGLEADEAKEKEKAEAELKNKNKNVNDNINNKHVADNDNTPINVRGMVNEINNKIDPIAGAWGPYNSIRAGNTNVNTPHFSLDDKSDDDDNNKDNNYKSKKGPRSIPFKDLSKPKEWDGTPLKF